MNKFEIVRSITDIKTFSSLIFDILLDRTSPEEVESFLAGEISEDGLRCIKTLALNGYPLSMERMQ